MDKRSAVNKIIRLMLTDGEELTDKELESILALLGPKAKNQLTDKSEIALDVE